MNLLFSSFTPHPSALSMSTRHPIAPPPDAPPESLTSFPLIDAPITEDALTRLQSDHTLHVLLISAFVVNLVLLAYLALRFEVLPDPLPLHFDASGLPDRIEAKGGIFGLPIIGMIIFVSNAGLGVIVHRWQRAAALLLAGGASIAQILMWFAAISIVGGIY
ncbi:MAG: DUF1648 domain-containing protein [Chloroflexi bacterium]|nr:DUF1648 domain-containing protein [Chloroflexota bacterium]